MCCTTIRALLWEAFDHVKKSDGTEGQMPGDASRVKGDSRGLADVLESRRSVCDPSRHIDVDLEDQRRHENRKQTGKRLEASDMYDEARAREGVVWDHEKNIFQDTPPPYRRKRLCSHPSKRRPA